jgi:hypothetical protein
VGYLPVPRYLVRNLSSGFFTCLMLVPITALIVEMPQTTNEVLASDPNEGQGPPRPDDTLPGLSENDERDLRRAVYDHDIITYVPQEGKLPRADVLLLRDEVVAIYKKKPLATLRLLLKIVEGGNPKDGMLAAGYAISLVQSPAVAMVCVRRRQDEFDKVSEGVKTTPRRHWTEKVKEFIEETEKAKQKKERE